MSDEVPEVERLRELIRKLSHDLRTPLSAILGWSEVLLLEPARDAKTQRGLETIKRNAQLQAEMLDRFADASKAQPHVEIPKITAPPAMPLSVAETPVAGIKLEGVRILVVDDEPDARELLSLLFEHAGANVTTAGDVEEAIKLVRTTRPDVIVSDIGMPDRDGYSLMRVVRSLPADAGGRTPAIALTAFTRSEDRTRALLAGYQVHVAKPIEPHELLATIASLIGRAG